MAEQFKFHNHSEFSSEFPSEDRSVLSVAYRRELMGGFTPPQWPVQWSIYCKTCTSEYSKWLLPVQGQIQGEVRWVRTTPLRAKFFWSNSSRGGSEFGDMNRLGRFGSGSRDRFSGVEFKTETDMHIDVWGLKKVIRFFGQENDPHPLAQSCIRHCSGFLTALECTEFVFGLKTYLFARHSKR